jgi:hypothetical protein
VRSRTPLTLEPLEARLTPAVAHITPLTLGGTTGTASLSNTGQLTFSPPTPGKAQVLDRTCSAFNVDTAGNLWFLESDGDLWEVVAGPQSRKVRRDTNVGAFSLSAAGVVSDLKPNGDLRRFANGAFDRAPLATGVTVADVDADGNVYGLVDGDLLKWAPGQTAATLLNNGASGGQRGNVASFQVGNHTVAWMLGNSDPNSARVFVSYTNGTSPALVMDNNGASFLAVYDVAADGSVVVSDPGAATNFGVTRLTIGLVNVDSAGTDLRVNGVVHAGTSFQFSPDGKAVAVLDGAGSKLSAYTVVNNVVSAEQKLATTATAVSFGIANDLKVYEFTNTSDLRVYDPFAATPVLTPTTVSPTVAQWQLGPNGQVAFRTQSNSFKVGTRTIENVAQLGFAPNGRLYYLDGTGTLFRGTGTPSTTGGTYQFARIDGTSAAFAVNNAGALLDVRTDGGVWRVTGPGGPLPPATSAKATVPGAVKLFAGAKVGTAPGSKQAGIATGTPLFVLPDGDFFFLLNQQLIQLTADRAMILANNQTDIKWESNNTANAGVTVNLPALNAALGTGTFFSALSGIGPPDFPITLL